MGERMKAGPVSSPSLRLLTSCALVVLGAACSTELAVTPSAPAAPPPSPTPAVAAPEPAEVPLPSPVTFGTASDQLDNQSEAALMAVLDYLRAHPSHLRIEGHTDNVSADNQSLSERRALAVAHWLVAHGTDCHRLLPIGFGATHPIADNGSYEGRALNRRTVFVPADRYGKRLEGELDNGGVLAGDPCGDRTIAQTAPFSPAAAPSDAKTAPAATPALASPASTSVSDGCGVPFKEISYLQDARMECIVSGDGKSAQVGKVFGFTCPARKGKPNGSTYGAGPFQLSSDICDSAVYSGKIQWERGGQVKIRILPPRGEYPRGETRNDTKSTAWKNVSHPGFGYELVD